MGTKLLQPLVVFLLLAVALSANAGSLVPAKDLADDSRAARAQTVPILVLFNSESCPYCEVVREYYVAPLARDRTFGDQVILRMVNVGSYDRLVDFDGSQTSHAEFASRHSVTLTPVVKFFAADGRELVPELLGLTTEEFYGWYLEQRLAESLDKLRSSHQAQRQ